MLCCRSSVAATALFFLLLLTESTAHLILLLLLLFLPQSTAQLLLLLPGSTTQQENQVFCKVKSVLPRQVTEDLGASLVFVLDLQIKSLEQDNIYSQKERYRHYLR